LEVTGDRCEFSDVARPNGYGGGVEDQQNISEPSMDIEFYGKVISGQGAATAELLSLEKELLAIVKEPLFPGSLNVLLKHPVLFRDETGTLFFDDAERRAIWPASLNGVGVWIYRWRDAPLHMVEIICKFNLRKRFNLQNGDRVSLRVGEHHIEQISLSSKFAWAAVWIGRRQWTYPNIEYLTFMEFGAAQQQPVKKKPVRATIWAIKQIIKRIPVAGSVRSIKGKITGGAKQ
jgi:hypothetical protein